MAAWIDLIGSFVFGGLLGLNVLRLNADMSDHSFESSLTYIAQSAALTIAQIVEEDVARAGYGAAGTAILAADSTQFEFRGDLDGDGAVDTLHYYLSSLQAASGTQNPRDRILYRALNGGTPQALDLGITSFNLSYFDAAGDSLALPVAAGDIRQIRIDLVVESAEPYDTTYARAFLPLRLWPKNL
jgi:hypothetical protein